MMIGKKLLAAGVALLLAGCSSGVTGEPVTPDPETGTFPTQQRTLGTPEARELERIEWLRMAATMPIVSDVDPQLRYSTPAGINGGKFQQEGFSSTFGSGPGKALAGGLLSTSFSAKSSYLLSKAPGAREVIVSLTRMPSPQAAAAAVSPALLEPDAALFGARPQPKAPLNIPGYPAAIAYFSTTSSSQRTVALVPIKEFVLTLWGDVSTDQVKRLADAQAKGLEGFVPTPMDKLSALKLDESGLARLTLPPESRNGYSGPVNFLVYSQIDMAAAHKSFADNGVDLVGRGDNYVFRARDESGAKAVAADFVAAAQGSTVDAVVEPVPGIPNGKCVTYRNSPTATSTNTFCVASAGRYATHYTSQQKQKTIQGIGASYLILRDGK